MDQMKTKSGREMDGKPEHEECGTSPSQAKENKVLTRQLLLKLDTRVLPILALLFLCSFLDRTNVGNARIIGLQDSLHLSDSHELPSNLLLKKVSPKILLPCLTALWGIVIMCLGFARGFTSFWVLRALLGVAEGGLLPGMVLYLSSLYTRGELAVRIGIFYSAASLSGAFGGLLARGLSAIGPRGGLEGWRWILIIEGLITFLAGLVAFVGLPNNVAAASYLTPEERCWAMRRLAQGSDGRFRYNLAGEKDEKFSWGQVRRGVFDVQVWLTSTAYFAILSGLYSFSLFLPTIVNGLEITSDVNQTELWTVIPYAVAAPITVLVAILSDRLKLRGTLMLLILPIAIAGYAVIANTSGESVRFAMTCLMAVGLYCSVPCILVWNSNNSAGHYKRATTSGLQLAVANCGGFVATFVYPSKDGPNFHRGHTIIMGLLCYAWIAILANVMWCARINRDKRRGRYDQYAGCGDDRDPEFKLVL
ncbi:Major facilitator superfamily domain, general substrate transporter [Metarhizium rileyi]|uniref:Major facilitator superfamily domain, general substrate transporter n=1 Tax=Metarhizium rileyi (strain RCEF 4871) TaxID=1649241 RepID=A0A166ZFC2_METRR|nr:Major facilitator superfamily domain, general substrate transporter [Metarhizium rileyi RCEF 4871]